MSGDLTNSITALTASSLASLRVNASSPANVARYLTRNEYDSFEELQTRTIPWSNMELNLPTQMN
jgi:hypothetical protein